MITYKHFYITEGLKKDIEDVAFLTGTKNVDILRKAAKMFLENGMQVNYNYLIAERNAMNYVPRNAMFQVWVDEWIMDIAEETGKKLRKTNGDEAGYSVILFQMLVDYIGVTKRLLGL